MPSDVTWTSPGSGRPLAAADAAVPDAGAIADNVARRLIVPRGPVRSLQALLGGVTNGSGIVAGNVPIQIFNNPISLSLIGASGIIRSLDVQFMLRLSGVSAGVLQLIDGTGSILRQWPVCGSAGSVFSYDVTSLPLRLPFLNGLTVAWTPMTQAGAGPNFSSSLIMLNIDYESIPIGQRTADNYG